MEQIRVDEEGDRVKRGSLTSHRQLTLQFIYFSYIVFNVEKEEAMKIIWELLTKWIFLDRFQFKGLITGHLIFCSLLLPLIGTPVNTAYRRLCLLLLLHSK
jgi:hypothetical protein